MSKRSFFTLLSLLCVAFTVARADTVSYLVSFTASVPGAPSSLVASATFELTLDPALTYVDANSIAVLSNSALPTSSVGFNYYPVQGILYIGGSTNGVLGLDISASDFIVALYSFPSASAYVVAYNPNYPDGQWDYQVTGNVTEVATTPEPSSIILLGTGLLGASFAVRRRLLV